MPDEIKDGTITGEVLPPSLPADGTLTALDEYIALRLLHGKSKADAYKQAFRKYDMSASSLNQAATRYENRQEVQTAFAGMKAYSEGQLMSWTQKIMDWANDEIFGPAEAEKICRIEQVEKMSEAECRHALQEKIREVETLKKEGKKGNRWDVRTIKTLTDSARNISEVLYAKERGSVKIQVAVFGDDRRRRVAGDVPTAPSEWMQLPDTGALMHLKSYELGRSAAAKEQGDVRCPGALKYGGNPNECYEHMASRQIDE